jgi:nitrite reductase/ring-hydroxylating ferredoxin subunit
MATVRLQKISGLKEGAGRKFQFKRDGVSFEGFVVRFAGGIFVYENRCRHLPLPLDYGDSRFFTPDGGHLVCSSHGAMYDPSTGQCIQGPCAGAQLKSLPFRGDGDDVLVEINDGIPSN